MYMMASDLCSMHCFCRSFQSLILLLCQLIYHVVARQRCLDYVLQYVAILYVHQEELHRQSGTFHWPSCTLAIVKQLEGLLLKVVDAGLCVTSPLHSVADMQLCG